MPKIAKLVHLVGVIMKKVECSVVLYVFARSKLNHFETAMHVPGILLCAFLCQPFLAGFNN